MTLLTRIATPACLQERTAKTTWLAARGHRLQLPVHVLVCKCFTFAILCAIAWGVVGTVLSVCMLLQCVAAEGDAGVQSAA